MDKHPKIYIIEYYDDLIREIDLYAESLLVEYNENSVLPTISSKPREALFEEIHGVNLYKGEYNPYDDIEANNPEIAKTEKAIEYINSMRERAIVELRKAQEENLRDYEANKNQLYKDWKQANKKTLISQLFANKFCFLIKSNQPLDKSIYKLLTVIVDFYLDKELLLRYAILSNLRNILCRIYIKPFRNLPSDLLIASTAEAEV